MLYAGVLGDANEVKISTGDRNSETRDTYYTLNKFLAMKVEHVSAHEFPHTICIALVALKVKTVPHC